MVWILEFSGFDFGFRYLLLFVGVIDRWTPTTASIGIATSIGLGCLPLWISLVGVDFSSQIQAFGWVRSEKKKKNHLRFSAKLQYPYQKIIVCIFHLFATVFLVFSKISCIQTDLKCPLENCIKITYFQ